MHLTRFLREQLLLGLFAPLCFIYIWLSCQQTGKVFIDNLRGISISCDMTINEPALKYTYTNIFSDGRDISGFFCRFSTFGFI